MRLKLADMLEFLSEKTVKIYIINQAYLMDSQIFYVGEDCVVARKYNLDAKEYDIEIYPFNGSIYFYLAEELEDCDEFLKYLNKHKPSK